MSIVKSYAIIGIGNPLRADDGIAHWVCGQLEKLQLPNVEIFMYQQLQTDLIESWLEYNEIIIVDAATDIKDVQLENAHSQPQPTPSSHHLHPSILKALIKELYQKDITITLCKIGASNFSLGESFSEQASINGYHTICKLIERVLNF